MQSVRASRDHHLFDGYPGLIAVFRALQSLLMPSHPPCALCSLTTRIECSRTNTDSRTTPPSWSPRRGNDCSRSCILISVTRTPPIAGRVACRKSSLGRTLPETGLRPGSFGILSRCQLPRPNCQGTKTDRQRDGIFMHDALAAREPVMDRGSPRN
jgi:hypothetical protein